MITDHDEYVSIIINKQPILKETTRKLKLSKKKFHRKYMNHAVMYKNEIKNAVCSRKKTRKKEVDSSNPLWYQ